jgi:hypothetical protein
MSTINILTIADKSRIKKINCKYPELYNPSVEEQLKEDYYNLLRIKDNIHFLREKIWNLEKELEESNKEFQEKYSLFNIEFETYTKEHITEKSGLSFGNLGNDLIGKQH